MELGKIVDVIETAPPVREIPADLLDDENAAAAEVTAEAPASTTLAD